MSLSRLYTDPEIYNDINEPVYYLLDKQVRCKYISITDDNNKKYFYIFDVIYKNSTKTVILIGKCFYKSYEDTLSFNWESESYIRVKIDEYDDFKFNIITKDEYNNIMISYLDEAKKILIDPLP